MNERIAKILLTLAAPRSSAQPSPKGIITAASLRMSTFSHEGRPGRHSALAERLCEGRQDGSCCSRHLLDGHLDAARLHRHANGEVQKQAGRSRRCAP